MPYIREWTENSGMWTAFFNPLYIPQLAFRTPFALMTAGLFFLFLVHFFTKEKNKTYQSIVRTISIWSLFFLPFTIIAGYWYWKRVPQFMQDNAPIAITTQNYTSWYQTILLLLVILLIITILTALLGIIKPKILPRLLLLVPFIVGIMLLGYFERIREFVRKPYVISDYMYANGLLVQNYPLYKESGILAHATYAKYKTITPENKLDAGSELFILTCSRCHTMNGINGVNKKFQKLFPNGQWQIDQISNFIAGMHNIRTFMPPFPGNKEELDALAFFICHYQNTQHRFEGAQSAGLNFGKTQ